MTRLEFFARFTVCHTNISMVLSHYKNLMTEFHAEEWSIQTILTLCNTKCYFFYTTTSVFIEVKLQFLYKKIGDLHVEEHLLFRKVSKYLKSFC